MFIAKETQAAFSIMFRLTQNYPDSLSSSELCDASHLGYREGRRVIQSLTKSGYISVTRGRQGGVSLTEKGTFATLMQIAKATEAPPMHPSLMSISQALLPAQEAFANRLGKVTFQDLNRLQEIGELENSEL